MADGSRYLHTDTCRELLMSMTSTRHTLLWPVRCLASGMALGELEMLNHLKAGCDSCLHWFRGVMHIWVQCYTACQAEVLPARSGQPDGTGSTS